MRLGLPLALSLAISGFTPGVAAGQEPPGWVGVSMDVVTTSQDGDSRTFVRIADVQMGSPAALAGLRPGDLLLRVNELSGASELARLPTLLRLHVGDSVRMVVRRGAETYEARMTAGARPAVVMAPKPPPVMVPDPDSMVESITRAMDSLRVQLVQGRQGTRVRVWTEAPAPPPSSGTPRAPEAPEAAVWQLDASGSFSPLAPYVLGRNRVAGAEVIDVRPELAGYFGVDGGVLVVDVPPGTLAAAAGLRPGDVIVQLADNPVTSVRDLRARIAGPGNPLEVWVIRHGERVRLLLAGH